MPDIDIRDQGLGQEDDPLSPLSTAPDHIRQSLPRSTSPSSQQRQSSLTSGQHIRLACQACQRKKIKCDRTFPCGQCTRSALQCVASQRKPRARHAGKKAIDSELRNRISKLESLVETLSGEVSSQQDHGDEFPIDTSTPSSGAEIRAHFVNNISNHASPTNSSEPTSVTSPAVRKYIGSSFWASLSDEVQALRDALEDEDAEDEPEPESNQIPANLTADDYDLLICPPGKVFVMPGAVAEPSPQVQAELLALYLRAVSPIHHVFHVPTLVNFILHNKPYLGCAPDSAACRAVKTVVWFAAVNASAEAEVLSKTGKTRAECIKQYRRFVDLAFYQANLMVTTELPTLQALCIYLVANRISDNSRRVWTMTALATRIAQAMGLQTEVASHTPFEKEIRRRLWHHVRFLDIMTAHDRGTEPMIYTERTDTPLPSNVNDIEFDGDSTEIKSHENLITDSSFSLVTFHATTFTARLNRSEFKPGGDTWKKRLELAQDYETQSQEMFRRHCDLQQPYHRLIHSVIYAISTSMFLRAVRPMQRYLSSVPPRVDSPYVLGIATACLRSSYLIYQDKELEQWRWLTWVQWHALAVALAGLCSVRDTDLANEAWFYAQEAFEKLYKQVADARSGMLWRPIEKLHRKATAFRNGGQSHPTPPSRPGSIPQAPETGPPPPAFPATQQIPLPQGGLFTAPNHMNSRKPTASWPFPFDNTVSEQSIAQTVYAQSGSDASVRNAFDNTAVLPPAPQFDMSVPLDYQVTGMTPTGLSPMAVNGDLSWLDWEKVMQDLPEMDMTETFIPNQQFVAGNSIDFMTGTTAMNGVNGEQQLYGGGSQGQAAGFTMF